MPTFSEDLTVNDNLIVRKDVKITGKIGVGTDNPQHKLDVTADHENPIIKFGLEGYGGGQLRIAANDNDDSVYLEAYNSKGEDHAKEFFLSGKWGYNVPRLSMHADTTYINGNVGIGTPFPSNNKLDVTADLANPTIKLGLEGYGGGQLQITTNENDNSIYLEAYNSKGDGHANGLYLTGSGGLNVPRLGLFADTTHLRGNLGIGTENPQYKLDVKSDTWLKLGLEGMGGGQLIIASDVPAVGNGRLS